MAFSGNEINFEGMVTALEELDAKGKIRLPAGKGTGWQKFGILPRYVTLVRADEDRATRTKKRTLADLDCFYCPEPLPYEVFSTAREKSVHLPLLVVENSATDWSCTAANRAGHPLGGGFFAAVVFGKGFKATRSTPIQSLDSLANIENQTCAGRIEYFGDLDPAGLAIPQRINENRIKKYEIFNKTAITLKTGN